MNVNCFIIRHPCRNVKADKIANMECSVLPKSLID